MPPRPTWLTAGNAGPFTLDGTRAYRVGGRVAAVIDPGPDHEDHLQALVDWLADATEVHVLVTHRHADHAGAAHALASALGARVGGPAEVPSLDDVLGDGDAVETDMGALQVVHTPGHTAGHLSYHWVAGDGLFVGDLLLGRGDTTWVGEYQGCVADYLASLDRVRSLGPAVLYPAHGPPIEDVPGALDRFEAHRRARIEQAAAAVARDPDVTPEGLVRSVYGSLPAGVEEAALLSAKALLDFVRGA